MLANEGRLGRYRHRIGTDQTKATWEAVFAGPLAGQKVTRPDTVTHLRIPPIRWLAGWNCRALRLPADDDADEYFHALFHQTRRTVRSGKDQAEFYRRHGIPPTTITQLLGRVRTT